MVAPFVYGFRRAGQLRRLLFAELHFGLYTALLDLHDQRAEPLGIHQRRQALYGLADLAALWQQYRARLAANQHAAVGEAFAAHMASQ